MRIIYPFLSVLLLFSFLASELDAKKRSGWGGSKRTLKSSSINKTSKTSKKRYSSSFDKVRDKKAKKDRSSKSYKDYQNKKKILESGAVGQGTFQQNSKNSSNSNIDIDFDIPPSNNNGNNQNQNNHKEKYDSGLESQDYFNQYAVKEQRVSKSFNSIYIVVGFVVIIGGAFFYFTREKPKKPFTNLPLDIRIGGIVDLTSIQSRLILNRDNFEMNAPETLKGYIIAIGEIKLDDELQIFNIYVSENIDDKESAFTLKIEILNGLISIVKVFTPYETVYPETVKDWEEWLDGDEENYPNIGGLEFFTKTGVKYNRVWEDGIEETVRTKYIESITKDEEHKDTLNIVSLYGKELNNKEIEYLFVSNIEDAELNNFVRIELGITIQESELVVI